VLLEVHPLPPQLVLAPWCGVVLLAGLLMLMPPACIDWLVEDEGLGLC
jgi:hypothetical protein